MIYTLWVYYGDPDAYNPQWHEQYTGPSLIRFLRTWYRWRDRRCWVQAKPA